MPNKEPWLAQIFKTQCKAAYARHIPVEIVSLYSDAVRCVRTMRPSLPSSGCSGQANGETQTPHNVNLVRFRRQIATNPFVRLLASSPRMCRQTRVVLPGLLLLRFRLAQAPLTMPTTLTNQANDDSTPKHDYQPVVGTGTVCLVCDSLLTSTRSGQGYYITNRLAAIERLAKFKLPQVRPRLDCRPDLAQHVWRLLVLNTVVWLQWIGEWHSWLRRLPPRPTVDAQQAPQPPLSSMASVPSMSAQHAKPPASRQALADVDQAWPSFLRHSVSHLPIMFRQSVYQLTSEELGLEYALRSQPLTFPLKLLERQCIRQDRIAFAPTPLTTTDELHLQCALLFPWRAIGSISSHLTITLCDSKPLQPNAVPADVDQSPSTQMDQDLNEAAPPCLSPPNLFMSRYFDIPTHNRAADVRGYLGMVPIISTTLTQSPSLYSDHAPHLIPLFDAFAIYGPELGSQIYAYCLSHAAPHALASQTTLAESYQITGAQLMKSANLKHQTWDPDQTYVGLGIKASPLGLGFTNNLFRLHQYSAPLK